MKALPSQPFTTADFSAPGGGIDFLGLRWVSLTIVGRDLIPQLNNVTQDMGVFALGAWIPWKFRQLCGDGSDYTEENYKAFREKVEVANAMTFREEAGLLRPQGAVRRQLGSTQKVTDEQKLTFKAAQRGEQNTLYAAANYGPALRALGLIQTYRSRATGGAALRIPVVSDDDDTLTIISQVDGALRTTATYNVLGSLKPVTADWQTIHELGSAGLDPAHYRAKTFKALKKSFRGKLLPTNASDPGYKRTLTARLVIETLRHAEPMSGLDIRHAWYTGRFATKRPLRIARVDLQDAARRWSCLMARQYQRFPLEVLLWCFEQALLDGMRSLDEVVVYWRRRSEAFNDQCDLKLGEFLEVSAAQHRRATESETSKQWSDHVQVDDDLFEHVSEAKGDSAVSDILHMIAGWYWRALPRVNDPAQTELMKLGGADRVSMAWFIEWLRSRSAAKMTDVVRDLFSELVFAQHMRIALARFDGKSQRLRFALSDNGIEPTRSARKDLAKLPLPWMPDRLDSLLGLLCDCDVLDADGDLFARGAVADEVIESDN